MSSDRDLDHDRRGVEAAEAVDAAGAVVADRTAPQRPERRAGHPAEHVLGVAEDPVELADVDDERVVGQPGPHADAVSSASTVLVQPLTSGPAPEQVVVGAGVGRLGRPDRP